MSNKIDINSRNKKYTCIVIIFLIIVSVAAFGRIAVNDFINFDDDIYVTENNHVQSGINSDSIKWAFTTTYAEFWHPLTWLSLMLDHQLYGLNAGGYHSTNLILHILSTLLLFWLFYSMTGAVWKSAFVAACFALHPLHVESVAWIAERKDVLSAFFWILTLCFYVYYVKRPVIERYLLVLFSFIFALMSKPIVVTLPIVMILLDYWPLNRFESKKDKSNLMLWQLKEKIPFFVLSAFFSVITFFAQHKISTQYLYYPLDLRIANAPVAFVIYLEKIFWPHDLAVFYPFPNQILASQVLIAALLIIAVSIFVIVRAKQLPYLFVGWLWYTITLVPVIGIIQVGNHAMADRYTYLPLIGIAMALAWVIPSLVKTESMRRKIIFPAAVTVLVLLSIVTWQQCGYWKNSIEIWKHTLQVTKNNYIAHSNLSTALNDEGKSQEAIEHCNKVINMPNKVFTYHKGYGYDFKAKVYGNRGSAYAEIGDYQRAFEDFNEAIRLNPNYAELYNNRGRAFATIGLYQRAIDDYNKAISLQNDRALVYYNRGNAYDKTGQYQHAIEDYTTAISLKPNYADAYNNIATIYDKLGKYQLAIENFSKAISLKPNYAIAYNNRGIICAKLGQYQLSINNFSKAIELKQDYADAYNNRGITYSRQGNKKLCCEDLQKACNLGKCKTLNAAQSSGDCR